MHVLAHWTAPPLIAITLIGVAVGRYPGLRMNRATIAMVGATLLVCVGALSLGQALASVDLRTLVLLFAIMVINVNLRLGGFFTWVAGRVMERARNPRWLLALVMAVTGVLAALLLNDAVCIACTPLVLDIVLTLGRNPVPYLVGLATAANIGSAATIVGNPQNVLIGATAGIPYLAFTARLLPVALAGLVLAWAVLVLIYRAEFTTGEIPRDEMLPPGRAHPLPLRKPLIAGALMLVLMVAGVDPPLAALTAAGMVLVTRRVHPERVFREIDWSLLVFFAGLFVVTGAIRHTDLLSVLQATIAPLLTGSVWKLAAGSALLSNAVSNVPAVLLFRSVMNHVPDARGAWLTLSMATTFAGNLTLLGSVANLIVAESARQRGVHLGFLEYLRGGVPIALGTLLLGILWLSPW